MPRRTHNAENERIKHRYFKYLREAKRYSAATTDSVAQALARFERYTKHQSFKQFHIEKAVGFKRNLAEQSNPRTGRPLSKSSRLTTLNALKTFFVWLAGQPGYRSRLSYADAEYFNMSEKDTRAAKAHTQRPVPTLDQIRRVIEAMPASTDIERRDRALVAFTILTGSRDGATISLTLKQIDLEARKVSFDGREVATKFSKSFTTWFFPVGDDIERIVIDWIRHLQSAKLWGRNDPLFPATEIGQRASRKFEVIGLKRAHWRTAAPVRQVFRTAFERVGLDYHNPHSFRNTLAQLGERVCRSPEEFKAWSQNLGHEKVMTTFSSYGAVHPSRQAEIIASLAIDSERNPDEGALLDKLEALVQRSRTTALP